MALSADGNTALVGGPGDNGNAGAVWVFTRSGTTWTQQGPKLVGTGAVGDAVEGCSVALSADGNTALVGGYDDNHAGAVWVFTRSGTTWTQQGPKLVGTGAGGDACRRLSVALSSDGNTALVGGCATTADGGGVGVHALGDDLDPAGPEARRHRRRRPRRPGRQRGAVVRREHRARRRLRRQRRCGGGVGVHALGDDLDPAGPKARRHRRGRQRRPGLERGAVGRREHRARRRHQPCESAGAAWVFTRSGTTWTQQGPKLVGTGAVGGASQGTSVALSWRR